jgi:hypothetical protein
MTDSLPHQAGTGTGIGHVPADPPDVQVHIAWDDGSMLAILSTASDLVRKLTLDHDPAG